jgi:hypothetical protein
MAADGHLYDSSCFSGLELGTKSVTRTVSSAQSIALSGFWSRGSVVIDSGSALLDHATVDGKSVPLEEEHT